jgi:glycerate-2-kinase
VIGQFPWEPFPPGEPDPRGPDPVHSVSYRAAVTAADAYHAVRMAVRREAGTLRVGNRFVAEGRYREVAFLSFGNAANSMALGALHAVGDRLTQGFIAGPVPVPPEIPFRGVDISLGWPGDPSAATVVQAATELAGELTEQDLLLVLLSPGAIRGLAEPPAGMTPAEFGGLLQRTHAAGATSREVGLLARVLGTGAVGGRLAAATPRADVTTLIVDRGDGATVLGGGPMRPVEDSERVEARALLARTGLTASVPSSALDPARTEGPGKLVSGSHRPVVIATPADALRAASEAVFDKGWTVRLAFLEIREAPEVAAERFLARSEELYRGEALTSDSRTKGVATFAMATLDVPEGVDEGPALGRFLSRAGELVPRREMSVGLFRTVGELRGVPGATAFPPGAVVGAPTDPDATVTPGRGRAVRMRAGITDVGCLAVALYPRPTAA